MIDITLIGRGPQRAVGHRANRQEALGCLVYPLHLSFRRDAAKSACRQSQVDISLPVCRHINRNGRQVGHLLKLATNERHALKTAVGSNEKRLFVGLKKTTYPAPSRHQRDFFLTNLPRRLPQTEELRAVRGPDASKRTALNGTVELAGSPRGTVVSDVIEHQSLPALPYPDVAAVVDCTV